MPDPLPASTPNLNVQLLLLWLRSDLPHLALFLAEFYSDSPDRLKAALYGLSIAVKKPESDQEQD